jgi:16S rRNA (cytosine967-C5)-methyltransferase
LKKRLHPNIIQAIERILSDVFDNNRYTDRVLEVAFKNHKQWGSRDRKLIAETTYNIVRWWLKLAYAASIENIHARYKKIISAYLMLQGEYDIPEWLQFKDLNSELLYRRYNDDTLPLHIKESIPEWLNALGEKELKENWANEIEALNEQAPLIIRVNTLKTNKDKLKLLLLDNHIESRFIDTYSDALEIPQRVNVFQTTMFKEGLFEVQDASSQLVAPFLQAAPGMRVIDACAGAGGKSLHLASLMQNRGRIVSMDVDAYKLKELNKRSRRNGVNIIETRLIDSTKVIKRQFETADCVLLDVPCSGLGVLRRNPDAKWKLSEKFIDEVRNTQQQILKEYSQMLKPGGKLVYATCSILPSENQLQVKSFLDNNSQYTLEEERTILPSSGFDGFYMARMKKL